MDTSQNFAHKNNESIFSGNEKIITTTLKDELVNVNKQLRLTSQELKESNEILKQENLERKENEGFVQNVIESLNIRVAVLDSEKNVKSVNKVWRNCININGCCCIFSIETGQNYRDVCENFIYRGCTEEKDNAMKIKSILNSEDEIYSIGINYFCNCLKEHKFFMVSTSKMPGKDSDIILIVLDVTEQKCSENEIQKMLLAVNAQNTELREDNRKLKHTQSKLIQQEKLAGIRRLAAGMAHEINNPLGFVMSNVETLNKYVAKFEELISSYRDLKDSSIDTENSIIALKVEHINNLEKISNVNYMIDDLSEIFKDINEGFKRICKIITELRLFSCVDQPDHISEYDLNLGIQNTLQIVQSETKYNVRVEVLLGAIPPILVNGGEINQVILNIIINAVHAIKECKTKKEGLIRITTYCDKKLIFCEIEDNGIGIESADLNKIFEPFFTTKPIGQGMGLGLSMSYDIIVSKYKGEILVKSLLGKGTIFTIKLPVS